MMKRRSTTGQPAGFTLIELMIVIGIILIIATMTLSAISYVRSSDRVGSEAARVQSFIMGARDRAIYADEPRGVRFFVEPLPPGSSAADAWPFTRTITSMTYIAPGGKWSAPEYSAGVDILRVDSNSDGDFEDSADLPIIVRGHSNPGWWNLKRRGWLVDGLRIRIPAGPTGHWYAVDTSRIDTTAAPGREQYLVLEVPFADEGNSGEEVAWENLTYEIEFPARLLPQEPVLLSEGVVIDLDGSKVPDIWRPATPGAAQSSGSAEYSGYMDLWFSPRGNIIGDAAAEGVLHFYVCDGEDSRILKEEWVNANSFAALNGAVNQSGTASASDYFVPMDEIDPAAANSGWAAGVSPDGPYVVQDRRVVTVFTQTGAVSVNPVNADLGEAGGVADSNNDGIADDPFRFAETGEVAE